MEWMERVAQALCQIRAPVSPVEYDLHALCAGALRQAGVEFQHEKRLGPKCRIDFYAQGVGIEIKRGRPLPGRLTPQLAKYAQSEEIDGLIVLVERNADVPAFIAGKPVRLISLNRLWGIAL